MSRGNCCRKRSNNLITRSVTNRRAGQTKKKREMLRVSDWVLIVQCRRLIGSLSLGRFSQGCTFLSESHSSRQKVARWNRSEQLPIWVHSPPPIAKQARKEHRIAQSPFQWIDIRFVATHSFFLWSSDIIVIAMIVSHSFCFFIWFVCWFFFIPSSRRIFIARTNGAIELINLTDFNLSRWVPRPIRHLLNCQPQLMHPTLMHPGDAGVYARSIAWISRTINLIKLRLFWSMSRPSVVSWIDCLIRSINGCVSNNQYCCWNDRHRKCSIARVCWTVNLFRLDSFEWMAWRIYCLSNYAASQLFLAGWIVFYMSILLRLFQLNAKSSWLVDWFNYRLAHCSSSENSVWKLPNELNRTSRLINWTEFRPFCFVFDHPIAITVDWKASNPIYFNL